MPPADLDDDGAMVSDPVSPAPSRTLFDTTRLGPVTLRNRIIKAATFEGATPGGRVTERLVEFHRRVAAGGAAMSTVAYLAVSAEGRTDRDAVHLRPDLVEELGRVTHAIHDEGAAAAAQIGHAGPVANAASNGVRSIAPRRAFNPLGLRWTRAATEGDLARVVEDFGRATQRCAEAGFDSVEVHLGHNYLLSSFLSPLLNRRSDRWGGPIEHRARLARRVLERVRSAADGRLAVTAKLNLVDGVRGGLGLEDSIQVARWLEEDGTVDALELTAGSSLLNPMFLFRGSAPVPEFTSTLPWYLRGGFRLVGDRFLRSYPYEEAFLRPMAEQVRDAVDLPIILLGGISRGDTAADAIDSGFDYVAMGRALLHDPGLVNRIAEDSASTSGCIHCNRCMPTIYSGTRCPLVDPRPGDRPIGPDEVAGPHLAPA
jgi:2,4-dienoyl-CoA reductase-like NADH-dependent reductase (Old Yellow Enzyme family)